MRFATSTAALIIAALPAWAVPVPPTDLDTLVLGATVVGPVGPTVDSSFLTPDGAASIGDFSGGAACPDGFAECIPPQNPAGTVYTFFQTVVPGADTVANDPPFAGPGPVDPGVATSYALGFAPAGFNGLAGYGFAEAGPLSFDIDRADDGSLTFTSTGDDWTAGTGVTFFFQTTRPPSGPGGRYVLSGDLSGTAAGPLPDPAPVPLPAGGWLLLAGLAALRGVRPARS